MSDKKGPPPNVMSHPNQAVLQGNEALILQQISDMNRTLGEISGKLDMTLNNIDKLETKVDGVDLKQQKNSTTIKVAGAVLAVFGAMALYVLDRNWDGFEKAMIKIVNEQQSVNSNK